MADIQGLLASPTFNLGLGLLNAGGYSPMPITLGQALGQGVSFAGQREQQSMQTQAMREALLARQRQNEFSQRIPGLFSPTPGPVVGPAPITTDQGMQEYMGLLMGAYPEQGIGLLNKRIFPEQPDLTSDVETAMALLGVNNPRDLMSLPKSVVQEALDLANPADAAERAAAEADLRNLEREAKEEINLRDTSIRGTARMVERAIQLNQELVGTIEQTGLSGFVSDWARTGTSLVQGIRALVDDGRVPAIDLNRIQAKRDELEAVMNRIPLDELAQYSGGTGATILNAFQSAKANPSMMPEANDAMLKSVLRHVVELDDAYESDIFDSEYRERLQSLYSGAQGFTGTESPQGLTLEAMRSFTPEQIMLIPEFLMTDEMKLEAARILNR